MRTILFLLCVFSCAASGCAISQFCVFYPRSYLERTEKEWRINSGGDSAVFVIIKRDSSTESLYGWVEEERLFVEIRNLRDDYTYYIPGDVRIDYYMKRGDKSDFTSEVEGVITVESRSADFVVLRINVRGDLFGERHTVAGIYGFTRSERTAPDEDMERKPMPTEPSRYPLTP